MNQRLMVAQLQATGRRILAAVSLVLPIHMASAQSCVQPPSDIVAWFPFDISAGGTTIERVAGNDGALVNGPSNTDGVVNGSLKFDGGNYILVPDSENWAFGSKDFTIELWARFDSAGGGTSGHPSHVILGNDEGPNNRNKWFFALGGGFLSFHINSPTIGPKFFPLVPFAPNIGQWYHLALVRAGNTYTIFVDGEVRGSAVNADSVPNANAPLTIGQAESLGLFRGSLDELAIYRRGLLQTELQTIFRAGAAGKCKSIAVHPTTVGNNNKVTITVNGASLGVTAGRLTRPGNTDIKSSNASSLDAQTITVTFDLTGVQAGKYSLILESANGSLQVATDAFVIEQGKTQALAIDIVGSGVVRVGQPSTLMIRYENAGTSDLSNISMLASAGPALSSLGATADLSINLPPGLPVYVPIEVTPPTLGCFDVKATVNNAQPQGFDDFTCDQLRKAIRQIAARAQRDADAIENTPLSDFLPCASNLTPRCINLKSICAGLQKNLSGLDTACSAIRQRKSECGSEPTECSFSPPSDVLDKCSLVGVSLRKSSAATSRVAALAQTSSATSLSAVKSVSVCSVGSLDPNAKNGPLGFGSKHFIQNVPLTYRIDFENLRTASAAARDIVIQDQLSPNQFDLNSVSIGPVTVGSAFYSPPIAGMQSVAADIDLRPRVNLIARVTASLDPNRGTLTWRLTTIDPATGRPPIDPLAGFLPPNLSPPQGEGSVTLTVMPKPTLSTGAELRNGASITFDSNAPISTVEWINTIDSDKPQSRIQALPPTISGGQVQLNWTGTDLGSGIQDFSLFVSENGGPFRVLLSNTTSTSLTFAATEGVTYSFYTTSRDNVGLVEDTPISPSATTRVVTNSPASSTDDKGHCFIATAAYGSYLAPEVLVLRQFRDQVLERSALGHRLVQEYYLYSPKAADFISQGESRRFIARLVITPFVLLIKYPFESLLLMIAFQLLMIISVRRMQRNRKLWETA